MEGTLHGRRPSWKRSEWKEWKEICMEEDPHGRRSAWKETCMEISIKELCMEENCMEGDLHGGDLRGRRSAWKERCVEGDLHGGDLHGRSSAGGGGDLCGKAPRAVINQVRRGLIRSPSGDTGGILGWHGEMLSPQEEAVRDLGDRTSGNLPFLLCIFWKMFPKSIRL